MMNNKFKLTKKSKIYLLITSIILLLIIILILIVILKNKPDSIKESPFLFENVELEVFDKKYLTELINRSDIEILEEKVINTEEIGKQELNFIFMYEEEKYRGHIVINIVDLVPPTILASSTYTVTIGSTKDLINSIICGDNYDNKPERKIIGDYDFNQEGTYNLTYYAKDSSGNESTKDFKLKVVPKTTSTTTTTTKTTSFTSIIEQYKNDNTEIGIDVSKWQGTIDFEKVKEAGCEFVIIRLGHQKGIDGELILDPYYQENIEKATQANLKVGVYLYTYAKSREDALTQAQWVIENIGPYELELGVSYDWESWTLFNELDLSFYNFNKVANTFFTTIEKAGYNSMLYSSKYYLENIWTSENKDIWLAHYTSKTDYQGSYKLWQMTSNGRIDGINGAVDINILYK